MLNYQLRKSNSTPYFTLFPPELIMFGEDAIVEAELEPDYSRIFILRRK